MAPKKSAVVRKIKKPATEDPQNSASENNSSIGNSSGARRKTQSGTILQSRDMETEKKQQNPAKEDAQNSASENNSSIGNSSGARRKTQSGTIVQSRYMEPDKKRPLAKHDKQNESLLLPRKPASARAGGAPKPRLGSPRRTVPRLSVQPEANPISMPSILETSSAGGNVLQSTALDSHHLLPEFDLSVIKENAAPPGVEDPEAQEINLEMETFLLTFLAAKIEHENKKLKEEAEKDLLMKMEEVEKSRSKAQSRKRQYLLCQKRKQINDLVDLQAAALTRVAEAAKPFTEDYAAFAAAVDTTRHALPGNNLHTEDGGKFLEKAIASLKRSQRALESVNGDPRGSESDVESLKEMKKSAHEIERELHSTSSVLLEQSSLVSREKVAVQQSLEEDN